MLATVVVSVFDVVAQACKLGIARHNTAIRVLRAIETGVINF